MWLFVYKASFSRLQTQIGGKIMAASDMWVNPTVQVLKEFQKDKNLQRITRKIAVSSQIVPKHNVLRYKENVIPRD